VLFSLRPVARGCLVDRSNAPRPCGDGRKLCESFTALSDLNLQSALNVNPPSLLTELYPRLNEGLDSIQKALEVGPAEVIPQEFVAVTEKVGVT
jgi:hypothetical protein